MHHVSIDVSEHNVYMMDAFPMHTPALKGKHSIGQRMQHCLSTKYLLLDALQHTQSQIRQALQLVVCLAQVRI